MAADRLVRHNMTPTSNTHAALATCKFKQQVDIIRCDGHAALVKSIDGRRRPAPRRARQNHGCKGKPDALLTSSLRRSRMTVDLMLRTRCLKYCRECRGRRVTPAHRAIVRGSARIQTSAWDVSASHG